MRHATAALLLWLTLCASAAAGPAVSISVFDPAIPADPSVHRDLDIFPRIRRVEALLWPFQLRVALLDRPEFQLVRVVPDVDPMAELSLRARILSSDGFALELDVRAVDATGKVWIERVYTGSIAQNSMSPDFQPLFDRVAGDLASLAAGLAPAELERIREVSTLRYAAHLAPSAFGSYLQTDEDGSVRVVRLPAENDPMIDRVRMVRESEFVVSDVIDEGFAALHADIADIHALWREYRRRNLDYQAENARRAADRDEAGDPASFEHLKRLYDVYKWDRITAQEQDRLAVAFTNEVRPTVEALESRIARLEVFIDSKQAEWNRLLEALFEVERRQEPPAPADR